MAAGPDIELYSNDIESALREKMSERLGDEAVANFFRDLPPATEQLSNRAKIVAKLAKVLEMMDNTAQTQPIHSVDTEPVAEAKLIDISDRIHHEPKLAFETEEPADAIEQPTEEPAVQLEQTVEVHQKVSSENVDKTEAAPEIANDSDDHEVEDAGEIERSDKTFLDMRAMLFLQKITGLNVAGGVQIPAEYIDTIAAKLTETYSLKSKKINPEVEAAFIAQYLRGATIAEMAEYFDKSTKAVHQKLWVTKLKIGTLLIGQNIDIMQLAEGNETLQPEPPEASTQPSFDEPQNEPNEIPVDSSDEETIEELTEASTPEEVLPVAEEPTTGEFVEDYNNLMPTQLDTEVLAQAELEQAPESEPDTKPEVEKESAEDEPDQPELVAEGAFDKDFDYLDALIAYDEVDAKHWQEQSQAMMSRLSELYALKPQHAMAIWLHIVKGQERSKAVNNGFDDLRKKHSSHGVIVPAHDMGLRLNRLAGSLFAKPHDQSTSYVSQLHKRLTQTPGSEHYTFEQAQSLALAIIRELYDDELTL